MSDLARQLIRENIEKYQRGEDARALDLGNCGMTEIPEEIGECVWVEELRCGKECRDWNGEYYQTTWESENIGPYNNIAYLPAALVKLQNLKRLELNGYLEQNFDLEDIAILTELKNIEILNLSNTRVSDLKPVINLTQLKELTCWITKISDLRPLFGLTTLKQIDCSNTQVNDLSPIADLTQIQQLRCRNTKISDLSPLSGLVQLQQLSCGMTPVSDLSPLSGLAQLQQLDCSSTQVSDLSPLAGLTQLQELSCHSTQVGDLSPLSGLKQLQQLSCWQTQVSDLSSLSGLTQLHKLSFDSTQVSDLSPLSGLAQLLQLNCNITQVSDLNPLSGLAQLQQLSCNITQVSDLSPLATLSALQELSCGGAPVNDLSPLSGLTQLHKLNCRGTQVSDLSPLSGLKQLQTLSCHSTQVSDLSPLAGLKQLQTLNCRGTQISDLSPLAGLKQLKELNCGSTQVSDLSPLAGLKQLKELNCGSTQVSDLSPLSGLTLLQQLDYSWTQVSDLSPILSLIEKGIPVEWKGVLFEDPAILVFNCPLICPPVEFAMESPQAVRDYFEELGEDGRKLNEVKVVFLGEASAGKTSLVKQLMGEQFDHKESQTHGIRIRKMDFAMSDGDTVAAHLWDFGGQEVMHATHQFFLSQRSVYVLLLNSRNEDQAEKWLKYAASFGGRSPVLVVLNKIDENPSFEVNRKTLREKYPQIREFYRLSCKDQAGINDFREALRREIENADTRRTPFPEHWLAVKEHFSNMQADYIESEEYQRECEKAGVTREFSQDVLLKFLHDLGLVINFRNLKNFDTQILNPLWLTNGVYRIINSERVVETGGLLHENEFDAVINDPRYREENTSEKPFHYPKNKLQYIVRVMQEFELCFHLNAHTYVVPQLLPVQEPDVPMEGAVLRFVIHFPDFLPDSLFPRLMVKLHTYIEGDRRWRTGMVLHQPNIFKASARVRWDKEDRKILVDVCGEERRRFLSFIRETVKEIVETFSSLSYSELVPIPDSTDTEEYEYLVEAEKAGEKEVFVKSLKKRVSIADLLNGVEEPAMRDEVEQLPVKAFVSYSHKDSEYLKEMRSALAPLIRLQKLQLWDDRDIDAGNEWREVIFKQLDEADIVLCLVSADFVASDFCYQKEFGTALEAHRRGEKTIVPVMLRKTDWQDLPLAELQGVPGEWITSAKNKDEAWAQVSASLRPALDNAKRRKSKVLEERRMGGGR